MKHWLQAEQELSAELNHQKSGNGSAPSAPRSASASDRNTGSDIRPLQGTRAGQAANRDVKRNSATPFANGKNGSHGASSASPAGAATATKRK